MGLDDYKPNVYGLDLPEALLREAYIMKPDISPMVGWETGRASEPAFMNMNLHAVRGNSKPSVVLMEWDPADPMNPLGLLVAYEEELVKPVVSDFDTFTIGSRGMKYDPVAKDQLDLVKWCLGHAQNVLATPSERSWTQRWLDILMEENAKGFHPTLPEYGFGDPTSYGLIGKVVKVTEGCGAVRHGAECFNYYFPQELDDEFLCIWEGYQTATEPPWRTLTEKELRQFLLDRAADNFSFPINPVWPIRDEGWCEILKALQNNKESASLNAWFPPSSGVLAEIERIRKAYPKGFLKQIRKTTGSDLAGDDIMALVQAGKAGEARSRHV